MKRWFYNWWTAHRLRIFIQYGWCPLCNSSPPDINCYVCDGSHKYYPAGHNMSDIWAGRYVAYRFKENTND